MLEALLLGEAAKQEFGREEEHNAELLSVAELVSEVGQGS